MSQNEVLMQTSQPEKSIHSTKNSDPAKEIDLEDGPLFRATIKEYEGKTSALKSYLKRILKTAAASFEAKQNLLEQEKAFTEALREAPFAEPLFTYYLDEASQKLHEQQERLVFCMQTLLISPLQKLYDLDIKTFDAKRKQFEDTSKEYYAQLSKYLSIKSTKKNQKAETEFLSKKNEFGLVRFDYYSFLKDLHGGKKEQEILYHLMNHHEKQSTFFQTMSKQLEPFGKGLNDLAAVIADASREQNAMNKERHEKRKILATKYTTPLLIPDVHFDSNNNSKRKSFMSPLAPDNEVTTPGIELEAISPPQAIMMMPDIADYSTNVTEPIGLGIIGNNTQLIEDKFKGIRDMAQQDPNQKNSLERRKEGFLFATVKPLKNNNPTFDMASSAPWHKYWCVLSGGQLHEYSNWKRHLELHIDPINLRFATVREARNSDRRFCFEVITPNSKRMYQATSDEEFSSWMATINNAISSLLDGMSSSIDLNNSSASQNSYTNHSPALSSSHWRQSKSLSDAFSGLTAAKEKYLLKGRIHQGKQRQNKERRRNIIGQPLKPVLKSDISAPIITAEINQETSSGATPQQQQQSICDELLVQLRKDSFNTKCADCSTEDPVWCSLNLGILICIECSGIHRSLGTHISKVRSLKLDSASFTPDIVQLLLAIGNAKSNHIWEALVLEKHFQINKPQPNDSREVKLKYIKFKYEEKKFVNKKDSESPQQILFQAIEYNRIPQALYAIALGVDVNKPFSSKAMENTIIPLVDQNDDIMNIRLPMLDIDGNEYTDKAMQVTLSNKREYFYMRYALHFALLEQPKPPRPRTLPDRKSIDRSSRYSQCSTGTTSSDNSNHSSIMAVSVDGEDCEGAREPESQDNDQYTVTRLFPMAELLFQNGADVSVVDNETGHSLAYLIGLGSLVDDEAIEYLNMKNSLRGQAPIVRSTNIPLANSVATTTAAASSKTVYS